MNAAFSGTAGPPQVLVSHPHAAAFSNGAASGLAAAGMLARYVTGVAGAEGSFTGNLLERAAGLRPVLHNRVLEGLDAQEVTSLGGVELAARAAAALGPRWDAPEWATPYNLMFPAHDAAVAAMPWPKRVDAVLAYEDAALWTFARARRRNAATIWDLPLPHHAFVRDLLLQEAARWPGALLDLPQEPAWKLARKDQELAAADVIHVASSFTRASLEPLQPRQPICVTPYGFTPHAFTPRTSLPDGPFSVVAVGSHDLRKGTPLLLEAWKRAAIPNATLTLVGPLKLSKAYLDAYAGLFIHVPHLPKSQLGQAYRAAHLLAFPTLGDGFGLVIQEAMACGTPVMTTRCGGGPEVISHGANGWILPEHDLDAWVGALRAASRTPERVHAMGLAARNTAEKWTWATAGHALASRLAAWMAGTARSFPDPVVPK